MTRDTLACKDAMLVAEVNGADQNSMLADSSKPCAEGAASGYPQTEDATENARLRARVAELEAQVELLKRPPSSDFTSLHVYSWELTDVQQIAEAPNLDKSSDTKRVWESWCPCCKKPLDIVSWQEESPAKVEEKTNPRYAYAAAIWGKGDELSGFVLGALVLGFSLQQISSHDRVLMYTEEVPSFFLHELGKVWKLRRVNRIQANGDLFTCQFEGNRFDGVFTKLHALNLTEYDKVLMMDIDLAILNCPDDLFELPAPAAMRRGNSVTQHGEKMHCRSFFGGQDCKWSQTGGINAGVMLFAPNETDFKRMLDEVMSDRHPERVPGNGPEQDYLSRYYAPKWTHISVQYNFQIHHIFHAMESAIKYYNGIVDDPWQLLEEELGRSEGDADRIGEGTLLRCISMPSWNTTLEIYESPHAYKVIGNVAKGGVLEALGRPVISELYRIVPVKMPEDSGGIGFVDLQGFEVVVNEDEKAQAVDGVTTHVSRLPKEKPTEVPEIYKDIDDGTILSVSRLPRGLDPFGLPVFKTTDSWHYSSYVKLYGTLIASGGATCVADFCAPLIPIKEPQIGYVDARFVQIVTTSPVINVNGKSTSLTEENTSEVRPHDTSTTRPDNMQDSHTDTKIKATNGASEDVSQKLLNGNSEKCQPLKEPTPPKSPSRSKVDDELDEWLPYRLKVEAEDVHIVHFSGIVKMWDRNYLGPETDQQFVDRSLRRNAIHGAKLWLDESGDVSDYAEYGIRHTEKGSFKPLQKDLNGKSAEQRKAALTRLVERGVERTIATSLRAAQCWRTNLEAPTAALNMSSLQELMHKLGRDGTYSPGDKVDVYWPCETRWYRGQVVGLDSGGVYWIKFDGFDEHARILRSYLRQVK